MTQSNMPAGKKTRPIPYYEFIFMVIVYSLGMGLPFGGGSSAEESMFNAAESFVIVLLMIIALILIKSLVFGGLLYVFTPNSYKYTYLSSVKYLLIIYSILIIGTIIYEVLS